MSTSPTDQDLEQLKKTLDIMRTYGILALEIGSIKITASPSFTSRPTMTLDDKEDQMEHLREALKQASDDADSDLYWST